MTVRNRGLGNESVRLTVPLSIARVTSVTFRLLNIIGSKGSEGYATVGDSSHPRSPKGGRVG